MKLWPSSGSFDPHPSSPLSHPHSLPSGRGGAGEGSSYRFPSTRSDQDGITPSEPDGTGFGSLAAEQSILIQ